MLLAGAAAPLVFQALRGMGVAVPPLIYMACVAAAVLLAGAWRDLALGSRAGLAWGIGLVGLVSLCLAAGVPGLFAASACGAAMFVAGLRGKPLLVGFTAAVGLLWLAGFTGVRISDATVVTMPAWLSSLTAGIAFAMVAVAARVPRHIALIREPVNDAYQQAARTSHGEMRELIDRGYATWQKTAHTLEESDANRTLVEEAVLRLFDVAGRWSDVERDGGQVSDMALDAEMEKLNERIAGTSDEIVKAQYENALDALMEQKRYVSDIAVSRERVVARMHNYVAAMERLRMAVVNLRSANASREAVDVQPMVDTLEEIGRDLL